jgi:hypothetical protein
MGEEPITRSDAPPVPPWLWRRFLEFQAAGKTGQVVLDLDHGVVRKGEFHESHPLDPEDED